MNRGVEVQYHQLKILAINSKKNCLVLVRSRRLLLFDVRTDLTDTWEVGETIIRKSIRNLSASRGILSTDSRSILSTVAKQTNKIAMKASKEYFEQVITNHAFSMICHLSLALVHTPYTKKTIQ